MNTWFTEDQTSHLRLSMRIRAHIAQAESALQRCDIYETVEFGRMLTLDDRVMVTEFDEFNYHELLSHPALCVHPNPRRVAVIGGGDGGTLREVVRHAEVEEAHLVEIDEKVIELCRAHLPQTARGFDNPKARITISDGTNFLVKSKNYFDVVLFDCPDLTFFVNRLRPGEFAECLANALREDGLVVSQVENAFLDEGRLMAEVVAELRDHFPVQLPYWGAVPSYPGGAWTFLFSSKKHHPLRAFRGERAEAIGRASRYYNAEIHPALFALPTHLRQVLDMAASAP